MSLLITGCARSGTSWIAAVLRSTGLDIGHERNGAHGTASWCLAPGNVALPPWHRPITNTDWPVILHQVREPLACISSLTAIRKSSYAWASQYIDLDASWGMLKCALHYWVKWNQLAEERALTTYRIEAINHPMPPKNTRMHLQYSWDDLRKIDPGMTDLAISLGARYGYPDCTPVDS